MKKQINFPVLKIYFICLSIISFLFICNAVNTLAKNTIKNIVLIYGVFERVYKILTKKGYQVSVVGNPIPGIIETTAWDQ